MNYWQINKHKLSGPNQKRHLYNLGTDEMIMIMLVMYYKLCIKSLQMLFSWILWIVKFMWGKDLNKIASFQEPLAVFFLLNVVFRSVFLKLNNKYAGPAEVAASERIGANTTIRSWVELEMVHRLKSQYYRADLHWAV